MSALDEYVGEGGSVYLCVRIADVPVPHERKERSTCDRCGELVWFDSHSYNYAARLGTVKTTCSHCMEILLELAGR